MARLKGLKKSGRPRSKPMVLDYKQLNSIPHGCWGHDCDDGVPKVRNRHIHSSYEGVAQEFWDRQETQLTPEEELIAKEEESRGKKSS